MFRRLSRAIVRYGHQRRRILQEPVLPDALLYDSFVGAADTALTAHTPDVRKNANNWTNPQGSFALAGNGVVEARFPTGGSAQAVATFDPGQADVELRVQFKFPTTGSSRTAGFTVRYTSNSDRFALICSRSLNQYRIVEVTGGTSTVRASGNFTWAENTWYDMRAIVRGDEIRFNIEGVGEISYTTAVGNTRTRHGLIANNTLTTGGPISFRKMLMLEPPSAAAVHISIGAQKLIARTRISGTIVDNNFRTDFAGATAQKVLGLSNLNGKYHNLNIFAESFGHLSMLGSWDGLSNTIAGLPQPNMTSLFAHWQIYEDAVNPDTWGLFGWRLPYQLTGNTTTTGVTTRTTAATYNQEGRRLLTDKAPQFVEHTARWSKLWFQKSPKNRRVYFLSEWKGGQTVVPVTGIRPSRSQSWEYDDYTGTPGRADMGMFAVFLYFRQGLMEGARRVGVPWSEIKIVVPYPVIAHQGEIIAGGSADAVRQDTYTDTDGLVLDISMMNGSHPTKGGKGWPYKAATFAVIEFARLLKKHGISQDEIRWGNDYGTFNNDNVPTPGISDQALAYGRVQMHEEFNNTVLTAYGFDPATIERGQPEFYAKRQRRMDVAGPYFVEEALRDDLQASILFSWYRGCYDYGIDYPDQWSFIGRGAQATDSGEQDDPNQWYAGVVKRPVTNNNDHPGSVVPDGGTAQAALNVIAQLKTHFPPGTPIHEVTITSADSEPPVSVIASDVTVAVQNNTANTFTFAVDDGVTLTINPYQLQVFAR